MKVVSEIYRPIMLEASLTKKKNENNGRKSRTNHDEGIRTEGKTYRSIRNTIAKKKAQMQTFAKLSIKNGQRVNNLSSKSGGK